MSRILPDPPWKRNPECQGEEHPVYKSKAVVPIDDVNFSVCIIWSDSIGTDYDSIVVKNSGIKVTDLLHDEVKEILVDAVAVQEGRL